MQAQRVQLKLCAQLADRASPLAPSGALASVRACGMALLGQVEALLDDIATLKSTLADSNAEIASHRRLVQDQAAQLEALSRAHEDLLDAPKAQEVLTEDQAVQTDDAVSEAEQLAFQQLHAWLGLEIAKELTPDKGLRVISVKSDGPAAIAGLVEDEYLHAIHDGGAFMLLTSEADFERVVKATVPGDTLKAEVYAPLCALLAPSLAVGRHSCLQRVLRAYCKRTPRAPHAHPFSCGGPLVRGSKQGAPGAQME